MAISTFHGFGMEMLRWHREHAGLSDRCGQGPTYSLRGAPRWQADRSGAAVSARARGRRRPDPAEHTGRGADSGAPSRPGDSGSARGATCATQRC
jgi:hypothetical protein